MKLRSLWIDGSATFTIVPSRMIINIPAQSTSSATHLRSRAGVESSTIGPFTPPATGPRRRLIPSADQVSIQELPDTLHHELPAVEPHEAVTFIAQSEVLHRAAERAQPVDELV